MLPNTIDKRLVLNSWKEIADYMGRGVRTVQRYERELRLPVHRPAGKSRSAVVAFADEIDQWMRKCPLRTLTDGKAVVHAATNLREWQRLVSNSELLLKQADALKTQMGQLSRLMQETERRRKLMLNRTAPRRLSETLLKNKEALRSKMTDLAQVMSGEVNTPFPVTHAPVNGHKDTVDKH